MARGRGHPAPRAPAPTPLLLSLGTASAHRRRDEQLWGVGSAENPVLHGHAWSRACPSPCHRGEPGWSRLAEGMAMSCPTPQPGEPRRGDQGSDTNVTPLRPALRGAQLCAWSSRSSARARWHPVPPTRVAALQPLAPRDLAATAPSLRPRFVPLPRLWGEPWARGTRRGVEGCRGAGLSAARRAVPTRDRLMLPSRLQAGSGAPITCCLREQESSS